LEFKKSPQLAYRLFFDSATQDEYRKPPSRRSLNPKSHRSGHLTNIGVAAVLHSIPSIRAPHREQCNRVPTWISLKTRLEKEMGVTESEEVPESWQLKPET
jgi:hypothetical protein